MSTLKQREQASRLRRIQRVRARVRGTSERPRLAVFRGLRHISAQIIDDARGATLAAAHDRELTAVAQQTKTEQAQAVGVLLAARALAQGVTTVVFDRRDKRYHGRVRALAEGARSAGLIF